MREPRTAGLAVSAVASLVIIVLALAAYAAPLVTIDKPRNLEVISGTADIHVSFAAETASPIERVEVFIDGKPVKDYRLDKPLLQGNVSFRWDFTLATPSQHSISARAQDASGAVGTTGIKVEVRRNEGAQPAATAGGADRTPPTVDIYYPAEGQVVSGEIRVKADVSDNVGVRTVVFYLDGEFKTMMMNSPNYADRLDTVRMADGPHVVRVSAFDGAENEGRAERTFIVQNREATAPQTGNGESRITVKPTVVVEAPKPEVPAAPIIETPTAPAVVAPAGMAAAASESRPKTASTSSFEGSAKVELPGAPAPKTAPVMPQTAGDAGRPDATGERVAKLSDPPTVAGVTPGVSRPEGGTPVRAVPIEMAAPPSVVKVESPLVVPKPKPVTSGLVDARSAAKETRLAAVAAPADVVTRPLSSKAGSLKAPAAPPARDVVRIAGLVGAASEARTGAPLDGMWSGRTTDIMGQPAVILAEPAVGAGYADDPVGQPRQSRVAMLPAGGDEDLKTKVAMPGIDLREMARFRDVKIVFDGKLIPLRAAPEVVDGISITPLREVFESCDGALYWFHQEKRVHAVNPTTDVELTIGREAATVNGESQTLALAPYIKNGRTMVPLEFLATTLDVTVSFNSTTGELIVSRNGF